MHLVKPRVFLIGETVVVEEGLQAYLKHIGAPEWHTDAPTGVECLIEVMGRICYRSFKPGLNPNVTQISEGNQDYLQNRIMAQGHGSVLEHPRLNFILADVSRVFIMELLRHRVGRSFTDVDDFDLLQMDMGISQESLRFVRLDNLGLWLPTVIEEDEKALQIFLRAGEQMEAIQIELAEHFQLDDPQAKFHYKKMVTSAMRRVAAQGLASTLGWSVNPRTFRWVTERRTAPDAEEEIRLVFGQAAEIAIPRYPNLLADFTKEMANGLPWYKPKYSKV